MMVDSTAKRYGASESDGETFPQHLRRRDPGAPPVNGQPRRKARLLHPLDRIEGQRVSCRGYKSFRWPRGSLGAPRSIPACAGEGCGMRSYPLSD